MIELIDPVLIKKILPHLKTASVKGKSNDGTWVAVYYNAFGDETTPRQIEESQAARKQNLDLHVYTGPLESINPSTKKDGTFVFTILSTTRVKNDEFRYRSFNVDRGEVIKFVAFPDLATQTKIATIQAVEVPTFWLKRIYNKLKNAL